MNNVPHGQWWVKYGGPNGTGGKSQKAFSVLPAQDVRDGGR